MKNLKERESLGSLCTDEREGDVNACQRNRRLYTGLIWLRIVTSSDFLRKRL
jgi:hypothetical protein